MAGQAVELRRAGAQGFEGACRVDGAVDGLHQGDHPRHMRSGHGGALHIAVTELAGSRVVADAEHAVGIVDGAHRAAGRHDVDARTVVGVVGAFAEAIGGADRDDAGATRRPGLRDVDVVVARSHDHDGLLAHGAEHLLHRRHAGADTAEAEVDDVGRVGVARHPRHGEAGRPAQGLVDVDQGAALLAEHPHVDQPRLPVHAGHPDTVVGSCSDGAGHVRAVVATAWEDVERVVVPAVAVQRVAGAGYEVVTGEDPAAGEVRMAGGDVVGAVEDAGVEDGHHRAVRAGADVPGRRQVDGRVMPLQIVAGVVRHRERMEDVVGVGVDDVVAGVELTDGRQGLGMAGDTAGTEELGRRIGEGALMREGEACGLDAVDDLCGRACRRRAIPGRDAVQGRRAAGGEAHDEVAWHEVEQRFVDLPVGQQLVQSCCARVRALADGCSSASGQTHPHRDGPVQASMGGRRWRWRSRTGSDRQGHHQGDQPDDHPWITFAVHGTSV